MNRLLHVVVSVVRSTGTRRADYLRPAADLVYQTNPDTL